MNTKTTLAVALIAMAAAVSIPTRLAAASRKEGSLPKLVDLGADKCIPCKMMAPILEQLRKEYAGRMDVEFIDVWKNEGAGKKYGIKLIPTQIFYGADGKELFRHEGFFGKEDILGKWKELGVDLSGKASAGLVRETPVKADTRPREAVCFMCDGDVNPKTKVVVKGQAEQRMLCSPHCYLKKWLDARPADMGRQITIAQALADKMKLTPDQIAKACKLGECK